MAGPADRGQELPPEIQHLVQKLSAQLRKDPRSKAFIQLAEEYAKIGQLQDAAAILEEGLKVYPTFITALVALGRVYVQIELPSKAQAILEEATRISPDNLLAHRMLARIYASTQDWDASTRACETVLFAHPTDEEMLALQAELAQHAGLDHPAPSVEPLRPDSQSPPTDRPADGGEDSRVFAQRPPEDFADSVSPGTHHPQPEEQPVTEERAAGVHASEPTPPPQDKKVEQLNKLLENIRKRRAP